MSRALLRLPRLLAPPLRTPVSLLPPLLPAAPIRCYTSWREQIQEKWNSQTEIEEARKWLDTFQEKDIPRKYCELTFAHASGPGGQNVNKSSTKATVHLPLRHLAPHVPAVVLRKIRENSRHLTKDDRLLVQSDESRSQHENVDRCFRRLHNIVTAAVREDLPGETAPEQSARVKELQRLEREARMRRKEGRKAKKEGRRGGFTGGLDA